MSYPGLRSRLLAAMLVPTVIALLLACVTLLTYDLLEDRRTLTRDLSTLAKSIAANMGASVLYDNQKVAQEMLAPLKSAHDVINACLYDDFGHIYSTYPTNAAPSLFPTKPGADGPRLSGAYLTIFQPVMEDDGRVGTLFIRQDLSGISSRFGIYVSVVQIHSRDLSLEQARHDLQRHAQDLETRVAERTRSLEETTRQLYDFCYSIAHDLKAPIRSQAGYARILMNDFAEKLGPEGTEFAQRIAESADRQTRLVSDLLTHVSLAHNEMPMESVDLAAIAEQVCGDLRLEIERRRASVDLSGIQGAVFANRASLNLIVINLFTNALKFVPRDRTPRVKAWSTEDGGFIRLWVEDNGIGISPQHIHKLFAIFQRLHTREEYAGTGIGLAIVKRAAERMNGRVGVESEEGKGSRFWVELKQPSQGNSA